MQIRSIGLPALLAGTIVLAGCSKSPSAPSGGVASGARLLEGQTVSAVDGSAAAGVSVRVGSAPVVTSDTRGYFEADVGSPGAYPTTVVGGGVVQRQTVLDDPGSGRATVSLIPTSFDLQAFDELCRTSNARLQRWAVRPSLVVVASVMSYRDGSGDLYPATDEQMSSAEVSQLTADLTEGLTMLTGGTYTSFAAVDVERPGAAARTLVARAGRIVVGRYTDISASGDGVVGYGNWQEQADGTVTGGSMFLDHDFDQNDGRRRLLRIHELGHALGYLHVTTRESIMNPTIGPEPTAFDRAATAIAFQRPPGNVDPDTDPAPASHPSSLDHARWVGPVACRIDR